MADHRRGRASVQVEWAASYEEAPMTISITRVYTRTGDSGETALVGGARVPKDSPRIVAYGTLDELNAAVGLARVFNAERLREPAPALARHEWLDGVLRKIQNQIFDLGSELATPAAAAYEGMFRVSEAEVTELERLMDHCQQDLGPLKSFVLPGGGRIQGFLHQARTVCRRAEREVLALSRAEPIGEWPLRYVNRLSDLFFVLGRWVGKHMGEPEYLWERGLSAHERRRAR
jgi:cob(I)alamin adenosyltransferase